MLTAREYGCFWAPWHKLFWLPWFGDWEHWVAPGVFYVHCSCGREYAINRNARMVVAWREVEHLHARPCSK